MLGAITSGSLVVGADLGARHANRAFLQFLRGDAPQPDRRVEFAELPPPLAGALHDLVERGQNREPFFLGSEIHPGRRHRVSLVPFPHPDGRLPQPAPGTFGASANFVFPEVVIVGYSYRPSSEWNFEFNAEWMNWNRLNTVTINNPTAPVPFGPATPLVLNWRSSFFWDFGVTHTLPSGLRVSAGYTYAENSTPDATYLPSVPDTNRHLFGAGVGGKCGGFDLQLTLQYGFAETRTVSGSPAGLFGQTADGTYRGRTYALALSAARRF